MRADDDLGFVLGEAVLGVLTLDPEGCSVVSPNSDAGGLTLVVMRALSSSLKPKSAESARSILFDKIRIGSSAAGSSAMGSAAAWVINIKCGWP